MIKLNLIYKPEGEDREVIKFFTLNNTENSAKILFDEILWLSKKEGIKDMKIKVIQPE